MRSFLILAALQLGASEPALLLVSSDDDLQSAEQLIRANARINEANDLGATPLSATCQNGSVEMARLLLNTGANPNAALLSRKNVERRLPRTPGAWTNRGPNVTLGTLALGIGIQVRRALRRPSFTAQRSRTVLPGDRPRRARWPTGPRLHL